MLIEQKKTGDYEVVSLHEKRLDASIAVDFKERMGDIINAGGTNVVLDLTDVNFIDSSGLGAIVSVLKSIGQTGELKVCGLQDAVMSMFKLTRMNKVFSIYSSADEALAT